MAAKHEDKLFKNSVQTTVPRIHILFNAYPDAGTSLKPTVFPSAALNLTAYCNEIQDSGSCLSTSTSTGIEQIFSAVTILRDQAKV